jgi:hypothetical protein
MLKFIKVLLAICCDLNLAHRATGLNLVNPVGDAMYRPKVLQISLAII